MKKILLTIFLFLLLTNPVKAAFGVSPPHIKPGVGLCPGDKFEQKIVLLRSDVSKASNVNVKFNEASSYFVKALSGKKKSKKDYKVQINDWITPNDDTVTLPKDVMQAPVLFTVAIPNEAQPGTYHGEMHIADVGKPGARIRLGAGIEVSFEVKAGCSKKVTQRVLGAKEEAPEKMSNGSEVKKPVSMFASIITSLKSFFAKIFGK